jgi:MFS family permease
MLVANSNLGNTGIFYGWYVVMASVVGTAMGWAVAVIFSFSSFAPLLHNEFGWSFTSIGFAMALFGWGIVITSPIVGWLIDKYGPRRVLLPSIFLLGLVVCSMSMLNASIISFYIGMSLMGVFGAGTGVASYSKILLGWFDKKRGLALGVGLSGVGVGAFLAPLFIEAVTDAYGWRGAYIGLGCSIWIISGSVCYIFLKNSSSEMGQKMDGAGRLTPQDEEHLVKITGLSLKEVTSKHIFWLLIASFFVLGITMSGVVVHMKQLLIVSGVAAVDAARVLSMLGIAVILGRVLAGYLMDRVFAPYVAVMFFLGPMIGYFMFIQGVTGFDATVAIFLFGVAVGAEFDILSFFTSKYFGMKNFGVLFGWIFASFQIGQSLGAYLTGYAIDNENLSTLLTVYTGGIIFACGCFLLLGPYTDFTKNESK